MLKKTTTTKETKGEFLFYFYHLSYLLENDQVKKSFLILK